MNPRIAFATFEKMPVLDPDDVVAAAALQARGAAVEAAVWSDSRVRWRDFDAVALRSTWDYHHRPTEFVAWLQGLAADGVHVCNPVETVLWNMDKRYLLELSAKGVPIVPTRWIEQGENASLDDVLREQGWSNAVVKPAVSVNSFGTFRTSLAEAPKRQLELGRLLEESGVLVQPFVREIVDDGEWSLLFFDGEFSHALVKRPAQNDFRTQSNFGGKHTRTAPSESLVRQGRSVLDAILARPVYARVDGVVVGGQFQLMELELIEPSLYLDGDVAAAERFAGALLQSMREHPR
ncbi:hypothetical protein LZC95_42015 [Pendulispora brunnea]|uniref:Prokaryotic glutathione synthetase ATP-binding domain-containing protein n=1 Tax=Pendulispora brunnea TaxID=2905690 RepID=A0ABZ2K2S0_9BACT